jgi:hypothetical protein
LSLLRGTLLSSETTMLMPTPNVKLKAIPPNNYRGLSHLMVALTMGVFAFLVIDAPDLYKQLAQEDAWIEWLTVGFFLTAGGIFFIAAKRHGFVQGWIIAATGLFCVVVAGEEISWGQRLVGFVPPEVFLESNFQQELNVHNFTRVLFKPKWLVMAVLAVWGILLPIVTRFAASLPLPKHLGITLLPVSYLPWSLIGIGLLLDYPVDLTSEYVEMFTGLLFCLAAFPSVSSMGGKLICAALPFVMMGAGYGGGELMAGVGRDQKIACARQEVKVLADVIAKDGAAPRLSEKSSVHKRIFTAIESDYLFPSIVQAFQPVECAGVSTDPNRRNYFIDPWGQPYWLQYYGGESPEETTLAIYSFGPNRRRDSAEQDFSGPDDIGAYAPLQGH